MNLPKLKPQHDEPFQSSTPRRGLLSWYYRRINLKSPYIYSELNKEKNQQPDFVFDVQKDKENALVWLLHGTVAFFLAYVASFIPLEPTDSFLPFIAVLAVSSTFLFLVGIFIYSTIKLYRQFSTVDIIRLDSIARTTIVGLLIYPISLILINCINGL